jgi:hypothetical protein
MHPIFVSFFTILLLLYILGPTSINWFAAAAAAVPFSAQSVDHDVIFYC